MLNLSAEVYDDYHMSKKLFESHGITIPFDPVRMAFTNPLFFDIPENGPLVGAQVLVEGGLVEVLGDGMAHDIPSRVATVIAHCHRRVVVQFPGIDLYVGWIEEDDFRVIKTTHPGSTKVN